MCRVTSASRNILLTKRTPLPLPWMFIGLLPWGNMDDRGRAGGILYDGNIFRMNFSDGADILRERISRIINPGDGLEGRHVRLAGSWR